MYGTHPVVLDKLIRSYHNYVLLRVFTKNN